MDEREEVVYTMSELQTILKIVNNTEPKNELNEWLKNNKNSKIVL